MCRDKAQNGPGRVISPGLVFQSKSPTPPTPPTPPEGQEYLLLKCCSPAPGINRGALRRLVSRWAARIKGEGFKLKPAAIITREKDRRAKYLAKRTPANRIGFHTRARDLSAKAPAILRSDSFLLVRLGCGQMWWVFR